MKGDKQCLESCNLCTLVKKKFPLMSTLTESILNQGSTCLLWYAIKEV